MILDQSQLVLDVDSVLRDIEAGYISQETHPTEPIRILNYTQKTQFNWRWTPETMQCRGLIVDDEWSIVARPFQKFFSVEQLNGVVPIEPFEAYEKLDGSLGILYHVDGKPQIATRGSFTSDQAKRATKIYQEKYGYIELDESLTYLFEIIYPENRIVVNYGDREDLILLAVIETETGIELPLPDIGFPVVKRYDGIDDFQELLELQEDGREGFVVRFESGQRVKIKFEEYKRLHKLLTGVSPKAIWEILKNGGSLNDLIERVPDEFYKWVQTVESSLRKSFAEIEVEAQNNLRTEGTRKELARWFGRCKYPSVMFAMLDGKDYREIIWKKIKPSGKAFRCDIDL